MSESGPCLDIINVKLPKPSIGALSDPVVNYKNFFFYSSSNECIIVQKSLY